MDVGDLLRDLRLLTLPQIVNLSVDISWTSAAKRTRNALETFVRRLPLDQRARLHDAALCLLTDIEEKREEALLQKSEDRKRKRDDRIEAMDERRTKKLRGALPVGIHQFPHVVGVEHHWKLLARYNERTSNDRVFQSVCGCCAGQSEKCDMTTLSLNDIPNSHLLHPSSPHPGHRLFQNMLLYGPAVKTADGVQNIDICVKCHESLKECNLPRWSLANNLWIGDVPVELSVLKPPEMLLISLYYPAAYILKLFPKKLGSHSWEDAELNDGLRGNVSTYKLDSSGIRDMVKGNLLPRPSEILASTFSVTLIGPRGKPERILREKCELSRSRMLEALLWLKRFNPLYANVEIDYAELARMPEGEIPPSIYDNIKHFDRFSSQDEVSANVYASNDVAMGSDDSDDESAILDNPVPRQPQTGDSSDDDEPIQSAPLRWYLFTLSKIFIDHRTLDSMVFPFPIDESAIVDVDGTGVSTGDLLLEAFRNMSTERNGNTDGREPEYTVIRGNTFVNEYARRNAVGEEFDGGINDPNHLLGAFPILFPYGCGGFETQRPIRLSYIEHAQWAIRYADKRFRKNITFVSVVFNVLQKRHVCLGAGLQIHRSDYQRYERMLSSVSVKDLEKAAAEEQAGGPPSNPSVRTLKSLVKATRRHVPGTDENRMAARSKIHGMSLIKNPATIWITISCNDREDPLVQIFSGLDIDMDNFDPSVGPGKKERVFNCVNDPYAATKYFFWTVQILLEDLLGIRKARNGMLTREVGIFGLVDGYMGVVEAQGRGSLHLHLLVWLQGAPTSPEMVEQLQDPAFRKHMEDFIALNIKAHVPGLDESYLKSETPRQRKLHKCRASAYSRPPNPNLPDFDQVRESIEFSLARVAHVHKCQFGSCLVRDKHGNVKCKRRAPWELSPDDTVLPSGKWLPKRDYAYLNSWSPVIMLATRANSDLKLLTNASDTRDVSYYVTKYATKPQARTYNATALLASRMAYIKTDKACDTDLRKKNRRLLSQCAHALNRHQELSSQQMLSYIMGYGDVVCSHQSVSVYLSSAMKILENSFPEFHEHRIVRTLLHGRMDDTPRRDMTGVVTEGENNTAETFATYSLQMTSNGLSIKSQLTDYMWRGDFLDSYSMLTFLLESYEPRAAGMNEDRYRHRRVPYLETSPYHEGRHRVMRHPDAEILPDFMGSWVPRNDRPEQYEFYCATILLLLKPWRKLSDLKCGFSSWEEAFKAFETTTDKFVQRLITNFQFHYETSDAASKKSSPTPTTYSVSNNVEEPLVDNDDLNENFPGVIHTGPAKHIVLDFDAIAKEAEDRDEAHHGLEAVTAAEDYGIFEVGLQSWTLQPTTAVSNASMNTLLMNFSWQDILQKHGKEKAAVSNVSHPDMPSSVSTEKQVPIAMQVMSTVYVANENVEGHPPNIREEIRALSTHLTFDQMRARDIVLDHVLNTLSPIPSPSKPLYMLVCGSGGAGKSTVIRSIVEIFEQLKVPNLLALAATSGVAATHIGGNTVHYWAGLPTYTPQTTNFADKSSMKIQDRRKSNIEGKRYLIIDEVSMLCQEMLGMLSYVTSIYSTNERREFLPFGGDLSVILIGDFHQFPPPARSHLSLYKALPGKSYWAQNGFDVFQCFNKVVVLHEQKRVCDLGWNSILERIRTGTCTASDVKEIRKLGLSHEDCAVPDFSKPPWSNAVLVTPRRGVRNRWNVAAVKKFCAENHRQLLISPAEISIHGQTLNKDIHSDIHLAVAQDDKRLSDSLPRELCLCVGMRALLTWNIHVTADLANGSMGTIREILLDPREPPVPPEVSTHRLHYPPKLVMFELDKCSVPPLPGLSKGIIPIEPCVDKPQIKLASGSKITIHRKQFPILPGYAFTDYKSQGQTLSPLLLDLRKPPSGTLSQFNIYVALSRGISRDMIRILNKIDETVLTKPPDDDLRQFMAKLNALDKQRT